MGRHLSSNRRRNAFRSPVVLLALLLVLALIGWFGFDFVRGRLATASCESPTTITVAAAQDVAPVVAGVAKRVSEEDGEGCYRVTVNERGSAQVAESLVLSTDGTEPPDVWIPESTMWLQRARQLGARELPETGASVASSPVVLGVAQDQAERLGWPSKTPTWADVLDADAPVGIAEPQRDPAGLSALFAIRQLTSSAPDPGPAFTSTLRTISPNTVPDQTELYNRLPGGSAASQPIAAFPTTEVALLRHNVRQADLVAVYANPPVPAQDYPYVVLPETAAPKRAAAEKFLGRVLEESSAQAFAEAGFRTPHGQMLRDRAQDQRVSGAQLDPVPLPKADDVDEALTQWSGVNLSARLQVLLDVSGSMNSPVPGTGKSRMDVTLAAAETGVQLFKPTTKFGMWLFSTNLDGDKDYKVLLPVDTVANQLTKNDALAKLRAVKAPQVGATGLYDSVLAAYQDARKNYEAGRINVVVVMTDGKNEDRNGISRERLLTELGKLQDPRRPIQVIGIGIGPDIDPAELQEISKATGGGAFTTADPTKITQIFYAALSKLLCQPPQCKPTGS